MPHATKAGDVLADRYRLVDLLSESGDGRFWRAHDRILERHVALHVIAADDDAGRSAARGGPAVGDGAGPAVPAGPRRRARRRLLLRRQRVGVGHLARHHARQPTARCRRARRPGSSPRSPTRSPSRTRTASPTGGWSRRTCWSTTPAPSGSSASASTPRCTACRRATRARTSATWPGCCTRRSPARWAGDSASGVPRVPRDARPGAAAAPGARRRTASAGRPVRRAAQPAGAADPRRARHRQRARDPRASSPTSSVTPPGWPPPSRPANPDRSETVTLPFVPDILARPDPDDGCRRSRGPQPEPEPEPEPDAGARAEPEPEPRRPSSCPPRPGCRSSTTRTTTSPGWRSARDPHRHRRRSRSRPSGRSSRRTPATHGPPRRAAADRGRRRPAAEGRRVLALRTSGPLERQRDHPGVRRPRPRPSSVPGRAGCASPAWSRWCSCRSSPWRSRSTSAAAGPRWAASRRRAEPTSSRRVDLRRPVGARLAPVEGVDRRRLRPAG